MVNTQQYFKLIIWFTVWSQSTCKDRSFPRVLGNEFALFCMLFIFILIVYWWDFHELGCFAAYRLLVTSVERFHQCFLSTKTDSWHVKKVVSFNISRLYGEWVIDCIICWKTMQFLNMKADKTNAISATKKQDSTLVCVFPSDLYISFC